MAQELIKAIAEAPAVVLGKTHLSVSLGLKALGIWQDRAFYQCLGDDPKAAGLPGRLLLPEKD